LTNGTFIYAFPAAPQQKIFAKPPPVTTIYETQEL
jgi:hypothetical protein